MTCVLRRLVLRGGMGMAVLLGGGAVAGCSALDERPPQSVETPHAAEQRDAGVTSTRVDAGAGSGVGVAGTGNGTGNGAAGVPVGGGASGPLDCGSGPFVLMFDPQTGAALEGACNGIDDDCDGIVDEDFDADGDGRPTCATAPDAEPLDCDDGDARVSPLQEELCDGIDNDCDGRWDEGVAGPCPMPICSHDGVCPGDLVCIFRREPCAVRAQCPVVAVREGACEVPMGLGPLPCDPTVCNSWGGGTCIGRCECAADGTFRWHTECTE